MSTQRVVSFELDERARAQVHARLHEARVERARRSCLRRRSALLDRARTLGAELSALAPEPTATVSADAAVAAVTRANAELAERIATLEAARELAARRTAAVVADVDGVLHGLAPGVPATDHLVDLLARARTAAGTEQQKLLAAARTAVTKSNTDAEKRTKKRLATTVALEELSTRAAGLDDTALRDRVTAEQRAHEAGQDVDLDTLRTAVTAAERAQELAARQTFARETVLSELVKAGVRIEAGDGQLRPKNGRLQTVRDTRSAVDVGAEISFDGRTLHWHATHLATPGAPLPDREQARKAEEALCDKLDAAVAGAAAKGVAGKSAKNLPPDGATAPAVRRPDVQPTVVVKPVVGTRQQPRPKPVRVVKPRALKRDLE